MKKVIDFKAEPDLELKIAESIDEKLLRIQILLEDMDKRLSIIEKSRLLSLEPEEIFAIYTPFQMEMQAVPIVSMFSRSDILLSTYRCELVELLREHVGQGKPGMSKAQILKSGDLLAFITSLREKHINDYGRRVCAAFNYRLLSPEEHAGAELDSLESLLIRFFGSANLDLNSSFALSKLKYLISAFGVKTDRPVQAMRMSNAVNALAAKSNGTFSESVDTGTWSVEIKSLLRNIQMKLIYLQNDLEETVYELRLNDIDSKKLFCDVSLDQVRELISHQYQKFVRSDLLLRCYEAELRFALMGQDPSRLSERVQKTIELVRQSIAFMQQMYIQKYAAQIAVALKSRIGVYNEIKEDAWWLDKALVYAFDMGIMQAEDSECPGLGELQELIVSLGKLLDLEEDADSLLEGIRSLEI